MQISQKTAIPRRSALISKEEWDQHVWGDLAPRLIDPTRVAMIEALFRLERPLAIAEFASILGIKEGLARYQCKVLTDLAVLEVAAAPIEEEPFFFFTSPPGNAVPLKSQVEQVG